VSLPLTRTRRRSYATPRDAIVRLLLRVGSPQSGQTPLGLRCKWDLGCETFNDGRLLRVTAAKPPDDLEWQYRLPQGDPRHGTVNGYRNLGCRCLACREAAREDHRKYMDRVRVEGRVLSEHGTELAYSSGCRCDVCREAHNKRSREYKRRRAQLRHLDER
jgi:hypothetical protein